MNEFFNIFEYLTIGADVTQFINLSKNIQDEKLFKQLLQNQAIIIQVKFGGVFMKKYVCDACGWEYDEALGCPEKGIAPGTPWSEVHDDFECPLCSVGKDMFSEG